MNLLTPNPSGSQTDISAPKTIRLVSIFPTEVRPERVSRCDSGYLDVQFEVPSGGAFRVMDVIVAEAPRFTDVGPRPASDARNK